MVHLREVSKTPWGFIFRRASFPQGAVFPPRNTLQQIILLSYSHLKTRPGSRAPSGLVRNKMFRKKLFRIFHHQTKVHIKESTLECNNIHRVLPVNIFNRFWKSLFGQYSKITCFFKGRTLWIFPKMAEKIKRDFQNLLKIFTFTFIFNIIVTFQCGFFYVNFSLVMKNSE